MNIVGKDTEIITRRTIHAPLKRVYEAWSDPELLKLWWGPNGFTNTIHSFDFRQGGRWKFTMHGPDAGHYENEIQYDIIIPEKFIAWDRISKPLFRVEGSFEAIDENNTELTFKMIFATVEECDKIRKFAPDKNEENFDRLQNVLNDQFKTTS